MRTALHIMALTLVLAAATPGAAQPGTASRDRRANARIDIAEPAHGLYAGSTVRVSAAVRVAGLAVKDPDGRIEWQSSDLSKAWVTDDGTLTLFEPGRVTLTATYGDLTARKAITVLANPARSIDLRGEPRADVRVNVPIRLLTRVVGADGPLADAHVHYAVVGGAAGRDPSAASVTDEGVFTASLPGVYTVVAEFGGKADHVTMLIGMPGVTTTPATDDVESVEIDAGDYDAYVGTTLPLAARVMRHGAREPVANPRIHWGSSDTDVAWVGQDGVVVFEGAGTVTITAEHGKTVAQRTFVVLENPARRIVLDTNARNVHPADTLRIRADVWSLGGLPVRNARVNYGVVGHTPGALDGARILEGGRFIATKPGLYTIVAELGGLSDTQTIMVRPRVAARRGGTR